MNLEGYVSRFHDFDGQKQVAVLVFADFCAGFVGIAFVFLFPVFGMNFSVGRFFQGKKGGVKFRIFVKQFQIV